MALTDLGDWPFWEHLGRVAPIVAVFIAVGAAIVAVFSLLTQVHIARRRAAIDVFLKTEMDHTMLTAYQDYVDGLEAGKQYSSVDQFKSADPKAYGAVRTYLNVNELICIGINHKAFDQRVCYGFWHGILDRARTEGAEVIKHARELADGAHTYDHILSVNERWQKPGREKWRR
jgi:hypothetical protein